jgi:hypothetical protein
VLVTRAALRRLSFWLATPPREGLGEPYEIPVPWFLVAVRQESQGRQATNSRTELDARRRQKVKEILEGP